ncbi:helix-turn-helix transcriptional regulator, MerR family, and SAM-dependent methyltransferase [Geotalea daltonii FRC-32]|uniref:Helix-turn-helix transcriptional regulator, MerR family, and SAM-dependent methyltransferase n=1 Tax=Geotalea daltonii (strain DSM 22248 / JCM 15807 / FRC-32) TaxID=316067 RepID=B9M8R3_GEODF|nr:MerR family transcriptional regulator [Geotalea daltonii]ACM20409.1 helix-turn-helix transcriptional regulator, MerR family, and SAM-dependent methyltransferase [Geotalea daltonii FRC-32]
MYKISQLARQFGLSRSTLLYYDRIGLLNPSARTEASYRLYSPSDRDRLSAICTFREAGLGIDDIRSILASETDDAAMVLRRRLYGVGEEIRALQTKQRLLAGMLKLKTEGGPASTVDKVMFVELLRAAGMDDNAMKQLHAEFERRAPEAHHQFLLSLGISEKEALLIRKWSADHEKELLTDYFFELYETMPRQGPGCLAATKKALSMLPPLPEKPDVLDLGCGSGAQTLVLAWEIDGHVTAVDNHRPFLDLLEKSALKAGLTDRIRTEQASMLDLRFEAEKFDMIWSEGALYILGIEQALHALRPLLKSGGCLAFTELTWLSDDLPAEVLDFWGEGYPAMRDVSGNLELAARCGYRIIGHFSLPREAWEEHYYQPLEKRLASFLAAHKDDAAAAEVANQFNTEISLYRQYPDSYGYVFYLLGKP